MSQTYKVFLDDSGRLSVDVERECRVLFRYSYPDAENRPAEGGIFYLEPTGPTTHALNQQFMDAARRGVAAKDGSFALLLEFGGFARLEVPRADVRKVLAG